MPVVTIHRRKLVHGTARHPATHHYITAIQDKKERYKNIPNTPTETKY